MRKDMAKVIVERERLGGKYNRKGKKPRSLSDFSTKESMKKPYRFDPKQLNENLKPLKRFLYSQVGRPWDKVFSEICENIRLTSAVQKHVRDHVFDYVHKNVQVEGKKVYFQRTYRGIFSELFDRALYVHPKNGLLKEYRTNSFKREKYEGTHPLEEILNKLVQGSGVSFSIKKNTFLRFEGKSTTGKTPSVANARIDAAVIINNSGNDQIFQFINNNRNLKTPYFTTLFLELERRALKRTYNFSEAEKTKV